ncbi:hypothetical protein [uncultured Ruegeria sp.]|uniref:hypothetical protein n=1 Tax=uncultured Ruegeria sp. TaxID=259304 RepID=UPI002626A690|nr:hypothetical protein [uncultured Ruegeria sp.]
MKTDSPKEIFDEILGVAMETAGLAVALDNAIFYDNGGLQDMHPETRKAVDGIAKALRRSTDMIVDQVEALEHKIEWSKDTMPHPKLVQS